MKDYSCNSRRFVYDPHSNILWCQIPKTGSTTYIDAYNKIARMYGRGNYGRLGKLHSDRERVKKMLSFNDGNKEQILARNPLIFSVVRHPYERLVSAYADFSDKPRSANELHGTFQVELKRLKILLLSPRTSWQSKCLETLRVAAQMPIVESTRTGIHKTTSARSAPSTIPGSRRWRPLLRILSKWAGRKV